MKNLILKNKQIVLVDDDDFEYLNQFTWVLGSKGEAIRTDYYIENGVRKQRSIRLHRMIMKAPKGVLVDHINGDRLDNRRQNLRLCNNSQNLLNQKGHKNSSAGEYKGFWWHKLTKQWQAEIRVRGKRYYLGIYRTKKEAAVAYNKAALKYAGEFAKLNEF